MVAECDGDYTYEKRGALVWQLPMIDAKNKTGSIEFSCGGNPDDFFPVQVAFFSKKSYSGIEVCNYELSYVILSLSLIFNCKWYRSLHPSKLKLLLYIYQTKFPI